MTDQPETSDCSRRTAHPAHRYMLGRQMRQCPGQAQPEFIRPVEHCGAVFPAFEGTLPTECVLRPGHQGSHANEYDTRWIIKAEAGYCPHCGRGDAGPSPDAYEEMRQQAAQAEAELDQMRKACDAMASKADDLAREAATTNSDALLHLATGYGEAARHIAATPSRSQPKETPDA